MVVSFKKLGLILAGLAVLAGAAWAAPATPGNHSAKAMVDKLYAPGNLAPLRDLVVEFTCMSNSSEAGGMTVTSKDKTYYKYPNKLRIDSVIQDPGGAMDQKQAIIIRDGINAWHYLSTGQYPVKKALDQPSATLNLPFNIQKYPVDNTKKYEFQSDKEVNGVNCKVIKITNPQDSGDVKTVYIDPVKCVPMRYELTKMGSDKKAILVRVDYKDVRKLQDGRFYPFIIEIYENDVLFKKRQVKGATANCGLNDTLFEPMKGFVQP